MAFDNDFLSAVGGHTGEAGGLFLYQTTDDATTVQGDGYFDSAANRLETDSAIIAIQETDTATAVVDVYHVENASGNVTVTQTSPS